MDTVVKENIKILNQIKTIINTLPPGAYTSLSASSTSCIGQHIRHILDHYLALKAGQKTGCINYNSRNRNSCVESDSEAALQLINEISTWLEQSLFSDKSIVAYSEVSSSKTESLSTQSSLSREFCYLLHHSIHHIAYIRLLAKNWDITLSSNIGIAPSTASNLRQQNTA